jgi:hypothetical protein
VKWYDLLSETSGGGVAAITDLLAGQELRSLSWCADGSVAALAMGVNIKEDSKSSMLLVVRFLRFCD